MTNIPLTETDDGCILAVHVTPKSAKDAVEGIITDDAGRIWLKIRVRAVPEDGKANKAVIKLLSKSWKLPTSSFIVISGETARQKRIRINEDASIVQQRLMP